MADLTDRQRVLRRLAALTSERASWVAHWREISEYLLPRSGRFFRQDRNRGDKRHNKIYDSTGTQCLRVLAAGLMGGMTSPARPWFRLTTSDPKLDESAAVKKWLADTTRIMQMIFAKSNTYRALHSMYEEMGSFGTAASIVLPDYRNVIHHYTLTTGEYCLAADYRGQINTLYREYEMTVGQMVEEFGKNKCSLAVQAMYDRNQLDSWIPVVQAIAPRKERDPGKKDAKNMAWESCYIEAGGNSDNYLRESGFKQFPALCPRWSVSGGDIYGNSPAMEALGTIQGLQHEQLRKAQGIDYQTRPPLQAPMNLKGRDVDTLPGGVTFVDAAGPLGGIRSAWDVNLNLQYLLNDIQDVRGLIRSSFYTDMFLMLEGSTNTRMTATEVAERHEEKMLMIGPVLERLHSEILDPLIEITFARMVEANIVPPPPQELQGMELNVEFVSMLAQAQRAIATNGVDRFVGNLGVVAQMKPDVLDKFDPDRWADAYADMLGIDPELIVPGNKVALIRKQRAQAAQAQALQNSMQQRAETAKALSQADMSGDNGLTNLSRQYVGQSSPDVTREFSGYN